MHFIVLVLLFALSNGSGENTNPPLIPVEICDCDTQSDTLFVINNDDSGSGSLRCALTCASQISGKVIIAFDLAENLDSTIRLNTSLPTISSSTWIMNNAGKIVLDGSSLSTEGQYGLRITGDSVIIRGLHLKNFPNNAIDNYQGHSEILVEKNILENCGRISPSGDGMDFRFAENIIIRNNIIRSNRKDGIYLFASKNVTLIGNELSYNQSNGINIYRGENITVGDLQHNTSNIISGNLEHGIRATKNTSHINIYKNYIGLSPEVTTAVPNGQHGIFLSECDTISIGDQNSGNFISGNILSGIKLVDSCYQVQIAGNSIGFSLIQGLAMPNGMNGIEILNSYNVEVGGSSSLYSNRIGFQPNHVYIGDSSRLCSVRHNDYFCSISGIFIEPGCNEDVQSNENFEILSSNMVGGVSDGHEEIQLYLKNQNCGTCQGNELLGRVESEGGSWTIEFDEPLEEGSELCLLKTDSNGNTSNFSSCKSYTCEDFQVKIIPQQHPYICENGSLDLATNTGVSYQWSTGETNEMITITSGGSYMVTVLDEKGCPSFDSIYVVTYAAPELELIPSDPLTFCDHSTVIKAFGQGSFDWNTGDSGPVLMVENSGNYCVSLTNQYNCVTTECVDIIKGDEVNAEIEIIGDSVICEGEMVRLIAKGGSEYLWNNVDWDQDTLSVTQSGVYQVTVTNEHGCKDTVSQEIIVNPAVNAFITPNGYIIRCYGDSVTLTAGGGNQFLWDNGSTSNTIVVNSWGNYAVTVENEYSCLGTVSQQVSFKPQIQGAIVPEEPEAFCAPGSIKLAVDYEKLDSISWNNGAVGDSILVDKSGEYIANMYNLGCMIADSVEVKVFPQPEAIDSIYGPNWSYPDSIQAYYFENYDPLYNYFWEVDGGELLQSSTEERAEIKWIRNDFGLICVTKIDSNLCESEKKCRFIDLSPLRQHAMEDKNIMIFPNPSSGILHIQLAPELGIKEVELEFLNPAGLLIDIRKINFDDHPERQKIDISDIPSGIYWVRINSDRNIILFEKLVLNN